MNEVLVTPAVDIQVVFDAKGDRGYQVRFAPIPLDIEPAVLNAHLDMVLGAVERQRAKYELMDEQLHLQAQIERLEKYERMLVAIEENGRMQWESLEGRRGNWSIDKLSPNHRNERERLQIALQNDRHDATARQEKIERLRNRMNGHASDSGANRSTG